MVFATNENPYHAKMTEIDALSRTRKRIGLTEKYESTNRHKISMHSFRSYFLLQGRGEFMILTLRMRWLGHTTYLGMYDRKDDSEKLELFLKVEPELKII